MRVTKIIREYVEKAVNAKYSAVLSAVGQEYKKEQDELNEKLKAIAIAADLEAQKVLASYPGYKTRNGGDHVVISFYTASNTDKQNATGAEYSRLRKEKDDKIQDILVNLELGATKTELDEMLKNL